MADSNEWDTLTEQLKGDFNKLVDDLVPHVRGGKYPPWQVPLPRARQIYEFLLFTTPAAQLRPEQQKERRQIWTEKISGWTEVEQKRWGLQMQVEIDKLVRGESGEPASNQSITVQQA